jgi:ATP-binding cassette, subfamily B, bacterial
MAAASDDLRQARIRRAAPGGLRAHHRRHPPVGTIALLVLGSWRLSEGAITAGELVAAMALFGVLAFPMRVVGFFLEELPRSVVWPANGSTGCSPPVPTVDGPSPTGELPPAPLGVERAGLRLSDHQRPPRCSTASSFTVEAGDRRARRFHRGGQVDALPAARAPRRTRRGTIRLGGVDVARSRLPTLRAATAIVFQESFLFADSLREHRLSTGATDPDLAEAVRIAQADRFIEAMPQGSTPSSASGA